MYSASDYPTFPLLMKEKFAVNLYSVGYKLTYLLFDNVRKY